VCFVSRTIYPVLAQADIPFVGGAEVQQKMIAQALRQCGHRVSVLTGDYGVADSVTADGIEIHHTPPAAGRGLRGLRRIHPRLTDVVRGLERIDPDWVYFRCAGGVLAACAWYARTRGKRLIYAAAHDHDFLPRGKASLERHEVWLYHLGLRWSDRIVVQSREQQSLLREHFGREGPIIPNCYAERSVQPGDAGGPVLWVGTVKPSKRPERFLELAARFPSRRFVMVGGAAGEGAAADYCAQIRQQAQRIPNLEFAGFVPFAEVGARYDGAAALINTSQAEGFPNTFLQAWIRGTPSLSFVAPTTGDQPTGTIVCRDPADMAAALGRLLDDTAAWGAASERVRSIFRERHSIEAVGSCYDALLSPAPPERS
jgi:glycosyltransferase involved in cell wall biosynthesis